MRLAFLLISLVFLLFFLAPKALAQTAEKLTLAILFEDEESLKFSPTLNKNLSELNFQVQEKNLTETISKNLLSPNRMNLSCQDARNLGQALGIEVFLVVKSKLVERAEVGATLYGECYLALAFVSSRSGQLILFDFIETKESTLIQAAQIANKQLTENLPNYSKDISAFLSNELKPPSFDPIDLEAIEIPDTNSPLNERFDQPEFLKRTQPIYSEKARKMAVSASIELEVVLRKDSTIGNIKILH
ncbi:MAG: hypothetical protein WAQ98_02170, partial [Blastocatellia bacterium]